jgi:hypothetical protein
MPQYTISVQGNVYKTITTTTGYNMGAISTIINADIASGNLKINPSEPISIVISPVAVV